MTDAWDDYLTAAQRLDTVRRTAASAAAEQGAATEAAQTELTALRARLEPQRSRLVRDLGVPDRDLTPTEADLTAATAAVLGGPAAVLTALRDARATADAADAAVVPPGTAKPWQRNLLVYGPFALVVLIVQVVLSAVADSDARLGYALLCSLTMPVVAFGLGWVAVGIAFGGTGRKVDRTPILGLGVCIAPILITCMGVGIVALLN